MEDRYLVISPRNAIANATNRFQGKDRRVLCVCSAGILRSPTAANVLHENFNYNTRACGLYSDYALIPVSEALLEWADEVVVMEEWMGGTIEYLLSDIGKKIPVFVLDILDNYAYNSEELQQLILEKYVDKTDKTQKEGM